MPTKKKLFLATPCYSNTVPTEYAAALMGTYTALTARGHELQWQVLPHNCYVTESRDILAAMFLSTECDDLLFIDADMVWRPEDVVRVLESDRDFIAGPYTSRSPTFRAWNFRPAAPYTPDPADGYYPITGAGTGFMKIHRRVFQKLIEAGGIRTYRTNNKDHGLIHEFFPTGINNDGFYTSEDYVFCDRLMHCGIPMWLDPDVVLGHLGTQWLGGSKESLRHIFAEEVKKHEENGVLP